ncbi:hypothetical protein, partial [Prevotella falsenii]|uniref:hypothetical protein n=1 Tax=Prevotella falsenii TaxID=515414 RepID=UPI001E519647
KMVIGCARSLTPTAGAAARGVLHSIYIGCLRLAGGTAMVARSAQPYFTTTLCVMPAMRTR